MKLPTNIAHPDVPYRKHHTKVTLTTPASRKAALVDLGRYALARGEWLIVAAITRLIEARGWRHA